MRAAAERLGYKTHRDRFRRSGAEPLAGKQIAIAMFGIDRTLAGLPVVAEAIHGAEEALAEAGAHPIIVNVPDPREPPRSLRRVRFDGVLAKAAMKGNVTRTFNARLGMTLGEVPLVWMLGRPAGARQVLFTSNLGDASAHSSHNLPVMLAGGGYRHQGHVSYGQGTDKPFCNLYMRMLRQFGVEADRFGSSDGVVGEI